MPQPPAPPPTAQELLDGIRDHAIFALSADGRIATWTAGAERVTGYAHAEAVGHALDLLDAPPEEGDESAVTAAELVRAAVADGSAERSGWCARKDGTRFWASQTVTALTRGDGGVAGFAVALHDETEWRREQEALRVSQTTFAGILEIASDAVVCVDEAQAITFFNRGAELMFGHAAADVVGKPLDTLIPHYARGLHGEHIRSFASAPIVARRMGERGEITGLRRNGEIFPAEASISKLSVGGTRVFTAVLRDVTERRKAEEALANQAQELARSNADLEQFAYVASHDLQEPLRMVASYTQLLARRYGGKLDADADEFIGYAVDGVTRMQSLINDLLAYSRVGTRGGAAEPTDMGAVLQRALVGLGRSIEETGATVTQDPLPTVTVDAGQFTQVFQNLVGNALKFGGDKPPRVHVSAVRGEGEWTFSVKDEGIGISPEFADRIFVIFQRLHSRGEYPGTGIGLAICKKVVERHGGRIWVDSAPGRGADFRFTVPDRESA